MSEKKPPEPLEFPKRAPERNLIEPEGEAEKELSIPEMQGVTDEELKRLDEIIGKKIPYRPKPDTAQEGAEEPMLEQGVQSTEHSEQDWEKLDKSVAEQVEKAPPVPPEQMPKEKD